ncbi:MAG: hypothetical protein AB2A00_24220 [Myxococcota bacterium]
MDAALLTFLTLLTAAPHLPCIHDGEAQRGVQTLPASYGVQLVGVGFNQEMEPTVVLRRGDGRNTSSGVYERGDKAFGRLEILAVGGQSALVRVDGALYVVKLKNRAVQRNWEAVARQLPRCSASTSSR